jgi:hypothetical protein
VTFSDILDDADTSSPFKLKYPENIFGMGGIGAVAEPLVVIFLLFGGIWINRDFTPGRSKRRPRDVRRLSSNSYPVSGDIEEEIESRSTSPSLLVTQEPKWRTRRLGALGLEKEVTTPNTRIFKGYFLSRLLERFPFLVECWYWALIYWVCCIFILQQPPTNNLKVYQLGRALTAEWIIEGTVVAAEKHALQVIAAEEYLHIFWELPIQRFFMKNIFLMTWINRTYSFIHIPGSIAFLVWLFYYTNTRNRLDECQARKGVGEVRGSPAGPRLYESRRRTMAFCNLLALAIFTIWPCMPPHLLSADISNTETGKLARSYGYVLIRLSCLL